MWTAFNFPSSQSGPVTNLLSQRRKKWEWDPLVGDVSPRERIGGAALLISLPILAGQPYSHRSVPRELIGYEGNGSSSESFHKVNEILTWLALPSRIGCQCLEREVLWAKPPRLHDPKLFIDFNFSNQEITKKTQEDCKLKVTE